MKPARPGLFSPWPDDTGPVQVEAGELAAELLAQLEDALQSIESAATAARAGSEEEDTLDQLYRRAHRLAGLADLLRLPKIAHVLAILDVALDAGRHLRGFERFSLLYVVQLLVASGKRIASDLQKTGLSAEELGDVVIECTAYVERALEELSRAAAPPARAAVDLAIPAPAEAPPTPAVAAPALVATPAPAAPIATPAAPINDGPEDLDIPADKLGLISDFCEEARENLDRIGHALVELERSSEPGETVNELFRSFHTVKGGARMLRIAKVERLGHEIETCLEAVRSGRRAVSSVLVDALLAGRDALAEMVEEVASRGPIRARMGPVLGMLAALDRPGTPVPAVAAPVPAAPAAAAIAEAVTPAAPVSAEPAAAPAAPRKSADGEAARARSAEPGGETIRIATEKLDQVLNTASEIFISRIRLQSDAMAIATGINELAETLQHGTASREAEELDRTRRRDERMLDDIRDVLGGGDRSREHLLKCLERVSERLREREVSDSGPLPEETSFQILSVEQIRKRLEKNVEHLEQLSSRLQHGAMSFRMVPITSLFSRFPTQVRTIARQLGKTVRLDIEGEETQLDKVLIGHLTDPLLHLLRNSLDHGLETPEQRRSAGKDETGRILLRASYQGSHAVIEIVDDGRGIDTQKVLARAIERGLVDQARAAQLEPGEILDFIFEPGFSTAEKVSEMSGRGVGMDVVRSSIHQIQGTVGIESEWGAGTRITLRLPLTLAVVWIVLVEEGPHRFAFPLLDVNEIVTIRRSDITELSSGSVCSYRGKTLPLTTLSSLLGFPPSSFPAEEVFLVVLAEGGRQVGIVVETIVGRQEVLIKNLGGLIKKVPFVMGCTILSDSRLVLILNPREVVAAATSRRALLAGHGHTEVEQARREHTILVIDDSAIQRKHLRSVLEAAGYAVTLAGNGFEALKAVRKRRCDAALVDIVMPLMDGFEFVEKIRRLKEGAGLPVFYVTSRRNAEDRERALSLGALAYFEKPVDPAALVEALDRCCLRALSTIGPSQEPR